MTWGEWIQFLAAWPTVVVAAYFIWLFGHRDERWWAAAFPASLMGIAVACLLVAVRVILLRLLGPSYWGRDLMLAVSSLLIFGSLLLRTLVLLRERRDRPYPIQTH